MSQTITRGRLRIDANFKRFVDEEVLPGGNWTLPRSGAILMRSFTIWRQKIVSCWQNAIAFRRRLMSGIAAIRGR